MVLSVVVCVAVGGAFWGKLAPIIIGVQGLRNGSNRVLKEDLEMAVSVAVSVWPKEGLNIKLIG